MLRRAWLHAEPWNTLANSRSSGKSFWSAAWQAIRRIRGDDLKKEQFALDMHYLYLVTSVGSAAQSGGSMVNAADVAERAVHDAKALSTEEMYMHVNRSVTNSLLSLAQRMNELGLPQQAQPAEAPVEADRFEQGPASAVLADAEEQGAASGGQLGHEHASSDASSVIAQEVYREQTDAPEVKVVPFESSRWLAGREKVTDKASRDEILSSLEPLNVPDADSWTLSEYREALQHHLGFQLSIQKSGIDHEHAGDGVWLHGAAGMGQVVAVHPGVVYSQAFHTEMVNFPNVARDNDFILARYDNTLIDAKPWGRGQHRARSEWVQQGHPLDCALNVVEGRHPLAFGHYVNHPPKGSAPNVMVAPFNLTLAADDDNLRKFFPYVTCTSTLEGILGSSIAGLALVAKRQIQDEELYLDYRLNPNHPRPAWYEPVDAEAERRRWS